MRIAAYRIVAAFIAVWVGALLSACAQTAPQADGSAAPDAGSVQPSPAATAPAVTDYSLPANWAYLETDAPATDDNVDVFFVCPSAYDAQDGALNMPLDKEETKDRFLGAVNMEKGIYDQDAVESDNRFFAPYYQQISFQVYEMPEAEREPYLQIAYADVKAAFEYYLAHCNEGRPFILAGFSQGADMLLRLMKDLFDDPALQNQLVACYAIGWRITQDDIDAYPQLKMAQGENDTGVIISFNSESPETAGSLLVPEDVKTLAINPLNWKTDGTPADKSENKGACFTDRTGAITEEIPELTGGHIDEGRGTLKVTDVTSDEYTPGLSIFQEGVFHRFDFQFFYRNLQENVAVRAEAYMEERVDLAEAA